jgi:hypothetical protein
MLLDPDPHSQYGFGSSAAKSLRIHADQDPQHCIHVQLRTFRKVLRHTVEERGHMEANVVDPDPHHFGNLGPDPDRHRHQGDKPDPDPHQLKIRIRIRIQISINVISRIRIRNRIKVMRNRNTHGGLRHFGPVIISILTLLYLPSLSFHGVGGW